MTHVKRYKDVNIYVNNDGIFYCDTKNNSDRFFDKTFNSSKLSSIEKAIDSCMGESTIDGNTYYSIRVYDAVISKIKVVKNIGDRFFFDDGSDTVMNDRRQLYPEKISEQSDFAELNVMFGQMQENQSRINELYQANAELRRQAEKIVSTYKKVNVTLLPNEE